MKAHSIYTATVTALATGLLLACGSGDDDDSHGDGATDGGTTDATTVIAAGDASGVNRDASLDTDAAQDFDSSASDASDAESEDGGASSDAGTNLADAADAASLGPATFTNVYATILDQVCATCHGSASGNGATSGHLLMDTQADAYSALVGVTAQGTLCGKSNEVRVMAGHSNESLLWEKVDGVQTCGSRMPLANANLTQAQIDLIAAWINAGANND